MATILHFDISADDTERARMFYEKLFSWEFIPLPEPMNYYFIETKDLKGVPGIGGGMSKRENPRQAGINNFVGVASIEESMNKVVELGGKIIQQKQAVPDWGYVALCTDTENNIFGLFQDDKTAK